MNALLEFCAHEDCLGLAANVLLQATLVILAAWALAHGGARRRAAGRHAIWLCALVAVLVSPLTATLTDRAGIETLRVPLAAPPETATATAAASSSGSRPAAEPRLPEGMPPGVSADTADRVPRPELHSPTPSFAIAAVVPSSGARWWRATAAAGMSVWGVVALWLLTRLLWRGLALRRLMLATCPADDSRLQDALGRVRRSLHVKTLPRVVVWRGAEANVTPVTLGIFRPVIVVSSRLLESLNADELRDVLIHECAHVLRRDALVGLLQRLAEIGFWFYPLVRLMNRELTRAREEVCDNYVLRFTDGPQYAQTLFDLAQKVVPLSPRLAPLGLLPPCWRLEDRVAGLLDPRRNTMTRLNRFAVLAVAAGFFAMALLVAGAKITQAEPQSVGPAAVAVAENPAGKAGTMPQDTKKQVAVPASALPAALTYTGRITEKGTGRPIAGATVTVRRLINAPYERRVLEEPKYQTNAEGKYTFTIPPEQVAQRFLYIELDVSHPGYAAKRGFGYALSMIRKNEPMGERPFFEHVELFPGEPISGTVVLPDGKPAAGIKVLGYSMADRHDFESGSFNDTATDDKGAFHLNLAKGADGVFWLLPKDFSPSTHVVLKKRGDVGRLMLEKGAAIKGRVLDQHGKPLPQVWVNAGVNGGPAKKKYDLPVADMLFRTALTDAKGEFALAPLPAGEYLLTVDEYAHDSLIEDRTPRIPPAVFGPQIMTLKQGEATKQVELRAMAETVIEGQYYDSKGKTRLGHQPSLWGRMPGKTFSAPGGFYHTYGKVDANGKFVIRAPKGLEQAKLSFITNEHSALRVRMKKDGPLGNQTRDTDLGTLDRDLQGIEVVRYEAPILLVKPVAEDGTPLPAAKMKIAYPQGRSPWEGGGRFVDGHDVSYERQPDGRLRTSQLLPDEEFAVTVSAEGRQSKSETLKIPEGAVRELVFKLQKGQDPKPDKTPGSSKR